MRTLEELYLTTRDRVVDLVTTAGEGAEKTTLPSCPSWSVHDVVAHLTGVCADILSGNVGGAATDDWTDAQVVSRRDTPFDAVLAEWGEVGPKVAAMLDDFPGWYGRQVIGDLTLHEHDIRGALGRPGARDSDAVSLAVDFLLSGVVHPAAAALGVGPLEVVAGDRSWVIGAAEATGDPDEAIGAAILAGTEPPAAEPVATVTADLFEVCRAFSGRRSEAQVRAYDWQPDPVPYLVLFSQGPFTLRSDALEE